MKYKVEVDKTLVQSVEYLDKLAKSGVTDGKEDPKCQDAIAKLASFGYQMYYMIGKPASGSTIRTPTAFSLPEILLMMANVIIFVVVGGSMLIQYLNWF